MGENGIGDEQIIEDDQYLPSEFVDAEHAAESLVEKDTTPGMSDVETDSSAVLNKPDKQRANETTSEATVPPISVERMPVKRWTPLQLLVVITLSIGVLTIVFWPQLTSLLSNWSGQVKLISPTVQGHVNIPEWRRELNSLSQKIEEQERKHSQVARQLANYSTLSKNIESVSAVATSNNQLMSQLSSDLDGMRQDLLAVQNRMSGLLNQLSKRPQSQQDSKTLANLTSMVELQTKNLTSFGTRIVTLEKNNTSISRQLDDLHKRQESIPQITSGAERLQIKPTSAWELKAASEHIAFIVNTESGQKIRISKGTDIPGCGPVLYIDAKKQAVQTQSCGSVRR